MAKRVAIVQSCYIPWKGYFDIIKDVDTFILLDDVQYTRRDWRNRNKIKTKEGTKWLTIPVDTKGKYSNQRIIEVQVSSNIWSKEHINQLHENYKQAPYYKEITSWLFSLYQEAEKENYLSKINKIFIKGICSFLGIDTSIKWSTDLLSLTDLDCLTAQERLLHLCKQENASCYVSGPLAQNYLDVELFNRNSIEVEWFDYSLYQPYNQLFGEFTHNVSMIDMLMMVGKINNFINPSNI